MATQNSIIPVGLCQCGCGRKTEIATATRVDRGHIKGVPLAFYKKHSSRWRKTTILAKEAEANGLVFCRGCKTAKPREDFFNRLNRHGKRCRNCAKNQMRSWKLKYPERARLSLRKANLKANYGVTPEQYQQILLDQMGLCWICSGKETRLNRRGEPKELCVDHCHKTGKVRGLLCHKCNNALGCLQDSVELLRIAIVYLEHFR